jgi:hypothetical protein
VNTQQIAEAFSSHRFDEVYDWLDERVTWVVPGQDPIEGKAAVIDTCTKSAAEFSALATTSFERFVSVGDDSTAAVDAIGRYEGEEGDVSVVSSADIYEFNARGQVVRITSYAVEL